MSNQGVKYTPDQLIDIAMNAPHEFKQGNLELAWKMYSYREIAFFGAQGRSNLGCPVWTGQDLKGKTLALCYEQTLGEQILFASMLPDLLAMGANLVVEVDDRLLSLFRRSFPTVNFVPWGFPTDPAMFKADYYTLMGNPGLRLRVRPEQFPKEHKAYLQASPIPGFCWPPMVGISWHSPASYDGHHKNIPLEAFSCIYNDNTLSTVSLQYGIPENVVPRAFRHGIDLVKNIDGLAGLVAGCDTIITISNTVAHLAGALGKDAYVLRPKEEKARLWYWDVPFYPTVKRVTKEDNQTWEQIITGIYNKMLDK